jgi:hypothetical protein
VSKSLVVVERSPRRDTRYRFLETIREYAAERLAQSGEQEPVRRRHLDFFRAWANVAYIEMFRKDDQLWFGRIEAERDNLRSALAWAAGEGSDAEAGFDLAAHAAGPWSLLGGLAEAQEWLAGALASAPASLHPAVRLSATAHAANLAAAGGDSERARTLADQALAGFADWQQFSANHQPVDPRREQSAVALALATLGGTLLRLDDYPGAKRVMEHSAAMFDRLGAEGASAWERTGLAWVALHDGDVDRAEAMLAASLAVLRETDLVFFTGETAQSAGFVARLRGDKARSRALFEQGLIHSERAGIRANVAGCLEGLGAAAAHQGDHKRAAVLFAAADALREAIGSSWAAWEATENQRDLALVRAALGEEGFALAWAEGRAMTLEQAVAYALSKNAGAH